MLVERRKFVREDPAPHEHAELDTVLADSQRLIGEIDVLLKTSHELTDKPTT